MKIPKPLAKLHNEALSLVRESRALTLEEREFVLQHFHEGANHLNGLAGAFFTPAGLARDLSIEVPERRRILDLCAGIGALSFACMEKAEEIVCVELNPEYVEVGKRVVPEAKWVRGDALDLDLYRDLGPFDVVISNPPFGRVRTEDSGKKTRKYTGSLFEYKVIETAKLAGAQYGVFIVPQASAPFQYSGKPNFQQAPSRIEKEFREQTGIRMEPNCGLDTSSYRTEWKGVTPICEIVVCDFSNDEPD